MASFLSVVMPLEYYNYTCHSEQATVQCFAQGHSNSCFIPATGVRYPAELRPNCVFVFADHDSGRRPLKFCLARLFSYMTSATPSSDQVGTLSQRPNK